jgi:hypothetical protein
MRKLEQIELEPWYNIDSDFSPNDPEYAVSRPYRLWFEFLRISPTYEMAGTISRHHQTSPAHLDIEDVIRTYDDFGPVRNIDFKSWWLNNSTHLFRKIPKKQHPSTIFRASYKEDSPIDSYLDSVYNYMNLGWREMGSPSVLLMAIPLAGSRKDIINSINKSISDDDIAKANEMITRKHGYYELQGKRLRLDSISSKLRLLWTKAESPDLELWRLGVNARLGDAYLHLDSSKLDLTMEMRTKTPIVASGTKHALSDAINIMENAARGRFPSKDNVIVPNINYSSMYEVILTSKYNDTNGMKDRLEQQRSRQFSKPQNKS